VIGFVDDGRFLRQVHPDHRQDFRALPCIEETYRWLDASLAGDPHIVTLGAYCDAAHSQSEVQSVPYIHSDIPGFCRCRHGL
jgi:hypothetical protein